MRRLPFPSAWYCDATPSGAYVVTYPQSHFETHLGRVELPPGEPWGIGYVRCTDNHIDAAQGFAFAGQAHSTTNPAAWEWMAGIGWGSMPPPACGVSPCIYDLNGVLHRSDCGPGVGSQGYRYVTPENVLVTGDATYGPFHGLFEYSAAGDLYIGQGAYDGSGVRVLTPDGLLHELE